MATAGSLRTGFFAKIDERCFKCDVCGQRFFVKERLDKHLCHTQSVFSCFICKKTFPDVTELDCHSAMHYQFNQYIQCPECKIQCANQAELFQHIRCIHPEHSIAKSTLNKNASQSKALARTPSSEVGTPRYGSGFTKAIQCDSLSSRAKWEDFVKLNKESANEIAKNELLALSESSDDSSGSDSKVKSILKTQKSTAISKVRKPVIFKEPVVLPDAAKMHPQIPEPSKAAKRTHMHSKQPSSPRKKQKNEVHADDKEDSQRNLLFLLPKHNQSRILKATKSLNHSPPLKSVSHSDKSVGSKRASTTVIQVGETHLVPIKEQIKTALKSTTGPSVLKAFTSASNLSRRLIDFPKGPADVANAQKIIINIPHQGDGKEQNVKVLGQTSPLRKQTPASPVPPDITKYRSRNIGRVSPSSQLQHLQKSNPELTIVEKGSGVQMMPVKLKTPTRIELSKLEKTLQLVVKSPSKGTETIRVESSSKTEPPVLSSASPRPNTGAPPKLSVTPVIGKKVSPKKTRIYSPNSTLSPRRENELVSKGIEANPAVMLNKGCDWKSLSPSVSVARLPEAVYRECIDKGYILIQSQKQKPCLMSRNVGKDTSFINKVSPNFQSSKSVAKHSSDNTPVSKASISVRSALNCTSPLLINPPSIEVIKSTPCGSHKVDKSSSFQLSNQNKPATVSPSVQVVKFIGPQPVDSKHNQSTKLKEAPFNPANAKVITISAELVRKLKGSILIRSPDPSSNRMRLVVPAPTLKQLKASPAQGTSGKDIKTAAKSTVDIKPPATVLRRSCYTKFSDKPGEEPVFQYDEQEERKRKEEVAKIKKKEKILKKMLVKYEEKEQKKQLKYYQKKLNRFMEKNGDRFKGLEGRLSDVVGNSSRLMEELQNVNCKNENEVFGQLLTNLGVGCPRNDNSSAESPEDQGHAADLGAKEKELVKITVGGFVNMAKNKVQEKLSSSPVKGQRKNLKGKNVVTPSSNSKRTSSRNVFTSTLTKADVYFYDSSNDEERGDQASYSKQSETGDSPKKSSKTSPRKVVRPRRRKGKPCAEDPFTDLSIITEEKFLIECPCQNPGCNGLHPEFSFS